ncbi:hypothetical protein J437_LFUL018512, partial [Ladona fulva]
RSSLLSSLVEELRHKSQEFLGGECNVTVNSSNGAKCESGVGTSGGAGSRFIDTVRKVWTAKVRNTDSNVFSSGGSGSSYSTGSSKGKGSQSTPPPPISENSFSNTNHGCRNGSRRKSGDERDGRWGSNPSSPVSSPDIPAHHGNHFSGGHASQANQQRIALSESDDSSLNSMDLDVCRHGSGGISVVEVGGVGGAGGGGDSDTGLESMSSTDIPPKHTSYSCKYCLYEREGVVDNSGVSDVTAHLRGEEVQENCDGHHTHRRHMGPDDSDIGGDGSDDHRSDIIRRQLIIDNLREQVTRLKNDKLDLLRQNVSCQRDLKDLRERELELSSDLASASKEVYRLRHMIKEYGGSVAVIGVTNDSGFNGEG